MFFVPTLRALSRAGVHVHLLCLSAGIGGPSVGRAVELRAAAATLGIAAAAVVVLDDARLRDGFEHAWDAGVVAAAVASGVAACGARLVVGFDSAGVTAHPNHIAAAAGLRVYAARRGAAPCYALESVAAPRRLVGGLLDVPLSALLHCARGMCDARPPRMGPRRVLLVHWLGPLAAHGAMRAHASQYVWYRVLWVAFSRYVWVNSLVLVEGERSEEAHDD